MASFRSSAGYRIAITYAAVFAWAFLLLGAMAYFVTHTEFRHQRDREIAKELHHLSSKSHQAMLLKELRSYGSEFSNDRFGYALFDREGKRIAGSLDIAAPRPGFHDLSLRRSDGSDRAIRMGAIALEDGHVLAVAEASDAIDRIDQIMLKFFLGAFLAVLAISAVGGFVLAWYLRRRLMPIEATANAIQTGDIEWRVPVGTRGDEFDKAGHALNLMLDRIARLMENLRQVSSDIAHDLRKPLIRLLHQTDRLGRVDGAEQRVHELGDEMIELFAAILRIAEIEGGELERGFVPVDLSALMAEVAEIFEPAFDDDSHSIDWIVDPGIAVMGNRELLAQVATNLLDNARIHTPAGTRVRLGLTADGADARLWVEDNGPGVSEEDRGKLLQRFFRAEASRTTPGNGLGLSLVAAVARAHRGNIAVEDAEPGLRISLRLPRLETVPADPN